MYQFDKIWGQNHIFRVRSTKVFLCLIGKIAIYSILEKWNKTFREIEIKQEGQGGQAIFSGLKIVNFPEIVDHILGIVPYAIFQLKVIFFLLLYFIEISFTQIITQ